MTKMKLKKFLNYPSTYTIVELKKISGLLKKLFASKSSGQKWFLANELKKLGVEPADDKTYQSGALRGEEGYGEYAGDIT